MPKQEMTYVLVVRAPHSSARWETWSINTVKEIIEWCKVFRKKDTPLRIELRETKASKIPERWDTDVSGLASYAHAKLALMQMRRKKFMKLRGVPTKDDQ